MEVTVRNFTELLPQIEDVIRNCDFIAIDLEYSGLSSDFSVINTIFDDGRIRYNKLRKKTNGITCIQFGMSAFRRCRQTDTYTSSTYSFYLLPQSVGTIEQESTFCGSALKFLEKNHFDFNKLIADGLPYLNREESAQLEALLDSNKFLDSSSIDLIENYYPLFKEVEKWVKQDHLNEFVLCDKNYLFPVIAYKVNETFPNISVKLENSNLVLKKVQKDEISEKQRNSVKKEIVKFSSGFSRVVHLIEEIKKPVVFHNGLMDIVLLYKQFIHPLPNSYNVFKSRIHETFPFIYDTKHMFLSVRSMYKKEMSIGDSSLSNLFEFFKNKLVTMYSSKVHMDRQYDEPPSYHHAGWDAYCTGFCFVHIAHVITCKNVGVPKIITDAERFFAIKDLCNQIYIGRAAQQYVCIDSKDPPGHRPPLLHFEILSGEKLVLEKVLKVISEVESADVKKYGRSTALIATVNKLGSKKILAYFKNHKDYRVTTFNVLKHSPVVRFSLWGSLFLSTSALGYALYKIMK